jgi:hypothetical protein
MDSSKALIEDAGITSYLDPEALNALQLDAEGARSASKPQEPGEPMACQGKRCTAKPKPKPKPGTQQGEPMACQGKCR